MTSNSPEQKLISALQAIIDAPGGGPARRIAIQAKPEVYVVIEELAELREKARWIPVSERLPDILDKQCVLVIVDGRKINPNDEPGHNKPFKPKVGIGFLRKEDPRSQQRDYWAVSLDGGHYFGCRWLDKESIETWGEITHWMPLPLPPEQKERT